MSADDGVYVLVTRGRKTQRGYKKEYRVVHTQAIECVTEEPNYPDFMVQDSELNRARTVDFFGKARVFSDRKVAEGYAIRLEEERVETFGSGSEYGIVWLDFAHIPFPRPQSSRRGRRSQRSLTSVG